MASERLEGVVQASIKKRTDEQVLDPLIVQAEKVISEVRVPLTLALLVAMRAGSLLARPRPAARRALQGTASIQVVYDGVWTVIDKGEVQSLEMYQRDVSKMCSTIPKGEEALQRKEAAEPTRLLSDAARAKPSFDVVVKGLAKARPAPA